jgi:hypothetical protein
MPSRAVDLPGTIFLVPGRNLDGTWRQKVRDHPLLPASPPAVDRDLNAMNAQGGVPARIESPRSGGTDPSLLVYGSTYVLRLFPTKSRSGYIIASVESLRLADHHRLATASLQVRPVRWEVEFELRQLPQEATAFWPQLQDEWSVCLRETMAQPLTASLADSHAAFLATVDRLIDVDEKISAEKAESSGTFGYRAVKPTGERPVQPSLHVRVRIHRPAARGGYLRPDPWRAGAAGPGDAAHQHLGRDPFRSADRLGPHPAPGAGGTDA